MSNFALSSWSQKRFGDAAIELQRAIPAALQAAHERAHAAHQAMGLTANDVYGQIWQTQHEELIKRLRLVEGVHLIRPKGARYHLAIAGEHNAILYPWRYGNDLRSSVDEARMRMSEVRRNLLELNPDVPDRQLSIEQAGKTEEEMLAEYKEINTVLQEMATAGRMVLIAYASNPQAGILRAYWGDATQADEDGRLRWSHREELPLPGLAEGGTDIGGAPLRPVPPLNGPSVSGPRFDDAPLEEPALGIRPPLTSPGTDPTAPQPETGSND
jgi:hypothetical protein